MRSVRVAVVIACLCMTALFVSRLPSIRQALEDVDESMRQPDRSTAPLLGKDPFAGMEGECALQNAMRAPPHGPPDVDFRRVPDTSRSLDQTVRGRFDPGTTICDRGFGFAYADKLYGTAENPHPFSRATGADDATPAVSVKEANAYAREMCNSNQPLCAFRETGSRDIRPDAARDRARWAALGGWNMYDNTTAAESTPPQYNEARLSKSYLDLPRPLVATQAREAQELGWLRATYLASDDAAGA